MTLLLTELSPAQLALVELSKVPSVVTPATLPELFEAHGLTTAQAAAAIDVEVALLERVIAGRQPLAQDLVVRLATQLGVGQGDVAGCAGAVSAKTGPKAHVALPPDPARGDLFPTFVLAETGAPPPPTGAPPSLVVWVCGELLGVASAEHGQASGVVRIERNSGLILSRTDLFGTNTPVELVTDGQTVFTAGAVDVGEGWGVSRLLPISGELIGELDPAEVRQAYGMVFDPDSRTVWVCNQGLPNIAEIDRDTGEIVGIVQLVSETLGYGAHDVIVVHGLLYVTATHAASPNLGRVFEVDPATRTVLRVSTGLNLQDAWGIAFDGDNTLLVASRGSAGNAAMLATINFTTFAASSVTVGDDPLTINDPSWVEFLFGAWWITDQTTGGGRLVRVNTGLHVEQSRTFGRGAGGHCASDGWFLWYADKANGIVHLLDPANIATSQVQVVTRGYPDGLLIF